MPRTEIIRSKNLVFHIRDGRVNTEAVVASHGGYTPRRLLVFSGSGKITIPANLEVRFYTYHDLTCIGTRAAWGIDTANGIAHLPFESATNTIVTNYSLSHHEQTGTYPKENQARDAILVEDGAKAHLSDVLDVIAANNLPYTILHNFHCRVDKTTFEF
jgi:hypothetical protein